MKNPILESFIKRHENVEEWQQIVKHWPNSRAFEKARKANTYSTYSSLVELETTVRTALEMTAAQSRFFKEFAGEREKILTCLVWNDDGNLTKRIKRVSLCCAFPRIMATKFDRPVLIVGRCKDRMCPRCSRHNAWQMSVRLDEIISKMNTRRMITLTLKHLYGSLKSQIDRLMDNWKKIRKTSTWKSHVDGGLYSLEIKYDDVNKCWHPHLHVIVEGVYFDQKILSDLWKKVTGDSTIVDIRKVESSKRIGNYISKYVTKPDEVAAWSMDILFEYMMAIRGRRLFHTFGCLHKVKVTTEKEKTEEAKGSGYTSIGNLIKGLNDGVVECISLFAQLKFAPKQWRTAFGIKDDVPGLHDSEIESFDAKQMHDLLDAATWVLRPAYKPCIPPKIKPPTLFEV